MVDSEIKEYLEELDNSSDLNFIGILDLLESMGVKVTNNGIRNGAGLTTVYGIHYDIKTLRQVGYDMAHFILLHEIAHYKRIRKVGKETHIELLSSEDFDTFFQHILEEELIADRYASQLYSRLNKKSFPYAKTQRLDLTCNQIRYRKIVRGLFGLIKHNEDNYKQLLTNYIY